MPEVIFRLADGSEKKIEVAAGSKITQAAYLAQIQIAQTCGGTPSCTDCKIQVLTEAPGGSLEEMSGEEKRLLGNVYHLTHERLSCQSVIKDSLTVLVPEIKVTKREDRE